MEALASGTTHNTCVNIKHLKDFLPDAGSADHRRDNHGSASGTSQQTHDAIIKHLRDLLPDGESRVNT